MESLDPDLVSKLLAYLDLSTLVSRCRQTPAGAAQTDGRSDLRRCRRSKTSACWW